MDAKGSEPLSLEVTQLPAQLRLNARLARSRCTATCCEGQPAEHGLQENGEKAPLECKSQLLFCSQSYFGTYRLQWHLCVPENVTDPVPASENTT